MSMSEQKAEWFSDLGNKFIGIMQKRLIEGDAETAEALERAVQVGFGIAYSEITETHEAYLRNMCQRCITEIDGRETRLTPESKNLPLWTFLAFAGEALRFARVGE